MRKYLVGVLMCIFATYTAVADVTCPTDFSFAPVFSNTFYAMGVLENNVACPSGYEAFEAPDEFRIYTSGYVVDSDVRDICENGYYTPNGCTEYPNDSCEALQFHFGQNSQTFSAVGTVDNRGVCPSGYEMFSVPDEFTIYTTGFVVTGDVRDICENGYYTPNGCAEYDSGNCANGFHDTGVSSAFDPMSASGVCESGFVAGGGTYASCSEDSTDMICSMFCGNGYTRLKTSTGLQYNVYSMRQTTPALNIGTPENRCYINVAPGRQSGAINIGGGNTIYHLTN